MKKMKLVVVGALVAAVAIGGVFAKVNVSANESVSVEKTDDGNYMVKFSNGKEKKMLPDEVKEYADKNAPSVVGTAVKGTIAFLGLCCLTNPATAGVALLGAALMGTSIGSIAHNIWDSGRGVDMAKLANQTE